MEMYYLGSNLIESIHVYWILVAPNLFFGSIVRVPLSELSAPPSGDSKENGEPQATSTVDNPSNQSDVSHSLNYL